MRPAIQENDPVAAAGVIVSVGHAEATAEEAQAAFAAGAGAVTHLYNAMSQLGHRQPGLVGAALADRNVICGFIADGHHVHETAARAALKHAEGDLKTAILLLEGCAPDEAAAILRRAGGRLHAATELARTRPSKR